MTISNTTDYAIRIMMCLAENNLDGPLSGRIISEEMNIPYNYFLKIVPRLKRAGLVESYQGKTGGFVMLKPADQVSLFDIICAMEDGYILNSCLIDEGECSRSAAPYCKVHAKLEEIQAKIDASLKNFMLTDMIDEK